MLIDDWEFNVLNVYNYKKNGHLSHYFNFCRSIVEEDSVNGDFCEFGVYRGSSLLGLAMMLKEMGSDRKIYGFDTWAGFPETNDPLDQFDQWQQQLDAGMITSSHYDKVMLNQRHIGCIRSTSNPTLTELSTSGNFDNCSIDDLRNKIEYLGLDNIELIQGPFCDTLNSQTGIGNVAGTLIDCDLYSGYIDVLTWCNSRVAAGAGIYLDEYFSLKFPGPRVAVSEFLAANSKYTLSMGRTNRRV